MNDDLEWSVIKLGVGWWLDACNSGTYQAKMYQNGNRLCGRNIPLIPERSRVAPLVANKGRQCKQFIDLVFKITHYEVLRTS